MSSNFSDIQRLLIDYFDMLYFCDLDLFDRVFHTQAIYASGDEEPALFRNMQEYRRVITDRVPPSKDNEARQDVIDSIQFAGDKTAFAQVRCSFGHRDFTDFLTLIRVDNEWKIISKVFHFKHRKPA